MTTWQLPEDSLTAVWWLLDDYLAVAWRFSDNWWLPDSCLKIPWQLFDDCLMATWQLPEDSLTTARYCLTATWRPSGNCLTKASSRKYLADFAFQSWIFDNRFNSKEHHWKNTSSQSSQEQTYRTEKARFCEYSQVTSVEFNRKWHSTYSCKIFCSYEKVNSVRFVK